MIGSSLGAWMLLLVAATAFATIAVGAPLAFVGVLALAAKADSALERVRRSAHRRRGTSRGEREPEALADRNEPARLLAPGEHGS